MNIVRAWTCVLPLALSACATTSGSESAVPQRAARGDSSAGSDLDRRFPRAQHGVTIEAGDKTLNLAEVTELVSRSTGLVYSIDEQTRALLGVAKLDLSQAVEISADQLYPWFESLLVQHGFSVVSPADVQPPMAIVEPTVQRGGEMSTFLTVPIERLDFLREHPALRVSVTLDLPHVDVRTLGNALRGAMSNNSSSGIMPIANTNAVLIRADGRTALSLVEILQNIDASGAKALQVDPSRFPQGPSVQHPPPQK